MNYESSLEDLKGIPFMPKSCKIFEKFIMYWVSDKELYLDNNIHTEGAPGSDTNYTKVRYHF